MSAAAVAAAIVARGTGFVKSLGRALAVDPGVQLPEIEGLALPADGDLMQKRAHVLVEDGAAHRQVGGGLTHPN